MTASERIPAAPTVTCHSIEQLMAPSWSPSLHLQEGAIHVWGFVLDATAETGARCLSWLDGQEQTRAARLVRAEDRLRYTLAHGGLRVLLGRYLKLEPQQIAYRYAVTGKPSVSQRLSGGDTLAFNLSHAQGRMLIAVSRACEVGVDLELVRRDVEAEKLADRFFYPAEQAVIRQNGSAQAHQQFFRYWVAKEAVLKAQGVGIASLQDCEILSNGKSTRLDVHVRPGSAVQPEWTVQVLSCGADWEGAVAAKGRQWIVQTGCV